MLSPGRGLRGARSVRDGAEKRTRRLGGGTNYLLPLRREWSRKQMLVRGTCFHQSEGGAGGPVRIGAPRPRSPPSASGRGSITIGTGTLAPAPERRQVRINGAPASVNSLSEWLSILWLTPAMDRLFTGSAAERRRFLDRLVLALEPGHAHHATRYDAAMRARNKLLANGSWDDGGSARSKRRWPSTALRRPRRAARTVAALDERLAAAPDDEFASAAIALAGWDGGDLADGLAVNRQRDAAAGRTTEGPHRQDLAVIHRAKQMPAERSSTGEQKALLLGLVLAHADLVADRRGEPPILLLDEVSAHLDPKRRAAFFARLEGRGQVWMTATEAALFDGIGHGSRFHVRPGKSPPPEPQVDF